MLKILDFVFRFLNYTESAFVEHQSVNNDHCQSESCLLEWSEPRWYKPWCFQVTAGTFADDHKFTSQWNACTSSDWTTRIQNVWVLLQEFVRVIFSLLVLTSFIISLFSLILKML